MQFFKKQKRTRSFDLLSSYSFYRPDIKGVLILLLLFLAGQLVGSLILMLLIAVMDAETALTYGTVIAYPVSFIPAMIYASVKSRTNACFSETPGVPLDKGHFGSAGALKLAFAASLATLAMAVAVDPLNDLLPEMSLQLKNAMERLMDGPLWLTLLSVSIFAPFFEEWLCRGMILRGLLGKMKPLWAILVSALVFGLIHGNIWQGIPATIIGALFGYVYWKTGSLKMTMLMHCVNNTFSVIMSKADRFSDAETFRELFPTTGQWLILYVTCLLILALFFLSVEKHIKARKQLKAEAE